MLLDLYLLNIYIHGMWPFFLFSEASNKGVIENKVEGISQMVDE